MAAEARVIAMLGMTMIAFGGLNACIGLSLLGERGEANKVCMRVDAAPS